MNSRNPRIFALLLTLGFFLLLWLYAKEIPVISNTIGIRYLVIGSMLLGLAVALALIRRFRARFIPWDRHRPDVAFILLTAVFFAPLLGSWINRGLGTTDFQSFEFVSETPYFSSGYGLLQGEKPEPNGYYLLTRQAGKVCKFSYKSQAYYPLTKAGEEIMLPIRKGLFGARVMLLR